MKRDFNYYFLIILAGGFLLFGIGFVITNIGQTIDQETDFKKTEINGIILQLKDINRGQYSITIKQSNKPDTLEYSLFIKKHVNDFNLAAGDSISKRANTYRAIFYKKRDDGFYKCCEYQQ